MPTSSNKPATLKPVIWFKRKMTPEAANEKTRRWGLEKNLESLRKMAMIAERENGPFICDQCPKKFQHFEGKIAHEMMHVSGEPKNITCTICSIRVSDHSKMVRHLRRHTGSKPFKCNHCGKRFARNDHRSMHVSTTCTMITAEERDKIAKKKKNKDKSFSKLFKEEPAVDDPTGGGVLFECKVEVERCKKCNRTFTSKSLLNKHDCPIVENNQGINLNDDDEDVMSFDLDDIGMSDYKPYACLSCNDSFNEEAELLRHIVKCLGQQRPFECTLCDIDFEYGNDLIFHHNKYHQNDNGVQESIKCALCNISFSLIATFTKHVLDTHPELMSLKQPDRFGSSLQLFERCTICKKILANKVELQQHMKEEHVV